MEVVFPERRQPAVFGQHSNNSLAVGSSSSDKRKKPRRRDKGEGKGGGKGAIKLLQAAYGKPGKVANLIWCADERDKARGAISLSPTLPYFAEHSGEFIVTSGRGHEGERSSKGRKKKRRKKNALTLHTYNFRSTT